MATQTRPFMITGAALAGAVAIVAASPAIAPNFSLPSPNALSVANVQLTTLSDVFTVPSSQWIASYFQGYGGLLGGTTDPTTQVFTPNPYAPNCVNNCYASGVPGILYLAADALANGNGQGWSDAGSWPTSAVNYYFEGWQTQGLTPLYHYLSATATSNIPVVQSLLDLFFAQPSSFVQIFTAAVSTTAALISQVPLVGPYVAGAMYAYIGFNGYTPGLSGVLNYVIDLVTGNITPPTSSAAATALAAAVAAPAAALQSTVNRALTPAKSAAPAVSAAAPSAAEVAEVKPVTAVSDAVASVKTEKAEAAESATGSDATAETKSADSSTESKPAETKSTETEATETKATEAKSTETEATETKPEIKPEIKPEVKPADTTPAATKPADAASSVAGAAVASTPAATKPAGSPAKTRKHPVRDAVQKATKQIQSALGGAKAGASK
jgi:hypothetical protein